MVVRGPWAWLAASSLVIGATLAVASAWIAAAFAGLGSSTFHPESLAANSARVSVPEGWTVRTWLERRGPGLEHHLVSECEWHGSKLVMMTGPDAPPQRTMIRVHSGWPWACMACSAPDDTNAGTSPTWWEFGLPLPGNRQLPTGESRRLPLRPVPPPFIATAGAWGLLLLVLGGTVRSVRRRSRSRRGLCPRCAYPVGAGGCPECGYHAPPAGPPPSHPKLPT